MTPRVQRLPADVAERIAAGEVVDRPLSIVKELVENSLDAQATRVEVEIEQGGHELIRITDNGLGMLPEDAELSVERHATSKLQRWEDLESLRSFGFRGEALPSVAAVSRFELTTVARGQELGTRVSMEGPSHRKVEPIAGPEGTRIDVRDLFWNTPARRKFLKSPSAETAAITDLLARFAILNPETGFRLTVNGKERLFLAPDVPLATRLAEYWKVEPHEILELRSDRDEVSVTGVIARPTQNRRNRGAQVLAVNGRLIRSQTLSQAFTEAFDPLVPRGRHPLVYAHLHLDPAALDVNIHPTKAEVRFAEERAPFRAVYYAIKVALETESVETLKAGAWESLVKPVLLPSENPSSEVRFTSAPPRPLLFNTAPPPPSGRLSTSQVMELYRPEPATTSTPWVDSPPEPPRLGLEEQEAEGPSARPKYLSCLYRSYLVMEVENELWVVDQHAAHERIQYERLQRFRALGPEQQGLVVPLPVQVTETERQTLEQHEERFAEVGFAFELLPGSEILLRAVPPGIPNKKVVSFFQDLLSDLEHDGVTTATPAQQFGERLRAMMACKSSVRANESVSEAEAVRLVEDLIAAERSPYCPHGRPTRIRLDRATLERLFQRT